MSQVEAVKSVYQQYRDRAQFYLIYIREAHPGEEIKQPETWEERRQLASKLIADMKIPIPTLVDGIDNKTESDYKAWPDRLYIIGKDGKVIYKGAKGPSGFKPLEMAEVLKTLETIASLSPTSKLMTVWGYIRKT